MLLELGLPRCSTVMHNAKSTFDNRLLSCSNKLVHATVGLLSVSFAILLPGYAERVFYSVCVCVFALVSCVVIACVSYLSLCLWTRMWSESNKYVCMYVLLLIHKILLYGYTITLRFTMPLRSA